MKIAFYLSSFDPFHNGHLKIIETAFERDKVDKVVLVPSMNTHWKHNKILHLYSRISIMSLSTSDDYNNKKYNIVIDTIERGLDEPYDACVTLDKLKERYAENNELFLLCSIDTAKSISNWRGGQKILDEWNLLTVERPKDCISSKEIIKMIKECKDISPYVSKNAVKLITRYYYYEVYNAGYQPKI